MVVVFSILVVNSIVQMGPLVFVTQSEKQTGQIDAIFSTAQNGIYTTSDYLGYHDTEGAYINYTQVTELYGFQQFGFAPRKQFYQTYFNNPRLSGRTLGRLTLIQTEREKEIGLGTGYPYGKLKKGQCLVNSEWMSDNNMTVGEDLSLEIKYTGDLSDAVLQYYNRLALVNGWPTDQTRPLDSTITGSCQIAGKLSETYGKYPVSNYQSTILMEYDTFL